MGTVFVNFLLPLDPKLSKQYPEKKDMPDQEQTPGVSKQMAILGPRRNLPDKKKNGIRIKHILFLVEKLVKRKMHLSDVIKEAI